MALQGKCKPCNIHYRWAKEKPLANMFCPKCGTQLSRTLKNSNNRTPQVKLD